MAKLIDGQAIAKSIYDNINLRVRELRSKGVIPKLAVVLVGDDPASRLYVNSKEKRAMENGIETEEYHLDGSVAEDIGPAAAAKAYGQAAGAVMHLSR